MLDLGETLEEDDFQALFLLAVKSRNEDLAQMRKAAIAPYLSKEDQQAEIDAMQEIRILGKLSQSIKARWEKEAAIEENRKRARARLKG